MQAHAVALTRNTSDALARARYLCDAAHRVVDEAGVLYKAAEQSTAAARHLRSDCQHIRDLWTDLRTASTGLVVRCAYCQRIRAHDGDWFGVGALVDHILQRVDVLVVSHGICADCAALYFPANGAASPAPAKLALGHAPGP